MSLILTTDHLPSATAGELAALNARLAAIAAADSAEAEFVCGELPRELEDEPTVARAEQIIGGVEYVIERDRKEREDEAIEEVERDAQRLWIKDAHDRLMATARAAGAESIQSDYSGLSEARYITMWAGDERIKIRIAAHDPRPTYGRLNGAADLLVGPHQAAYIDGAGEDVDAACEWLTARIARLIAEAEEDE